MIFSLSAIDDWPLSGSNIYFAIRRQLVVQLKAIPEETHQRQGATPAPPPATKAIPSLRLLFRCCYSQKFKETVRVDFLAYDR
jgi:hypothetical protein